MGFGPTSASGASGRNIQGAIWAHLALNNASGAFRAAVSLGLSGGCGGDQIGEQLGKFVYRFELDGAANQVSDELAGVAQVVLPLWWWLPLPKLPPALIVCGLVAESAAGTATWPPMVVCWRIRFPPSGLHVGGDDLADSKVSSFKPVPRCSPTATTKHSRRRERQFSSCAPPIRPLQQLRPPSSGQPRRVGQLAG